jgi:RIP metalloprotease RseP
MSVLFLVGIVVFFFGLLASIALHELGHLSFAKLFGVRVPQYMVGFGPTMWSRHKGETEYGVKWIPLGGYIRMIGMLPPRRDDAPGMVRGSSTGPF